MNSRQTGASDQESYLFSCSGEKIVLLNFSPKDNTCLKKGSFSPHASTRIETIIWNHNNKVIIAGSDDKNVSMTIADSMKALGKLENQSEVKALAITQGSKYLAVGGGANIIRIWDLKQNIVIKEHREHVDTVTCMEFSDNDRYLATASRSGDVIIYNEETGTISTRLRPQMTQGIHCLSYSPYLSNLLATAGDDGCVHVWDTSQSKLLCSFQEHKAPCVSVRWSNLNDGLLISAGLDKKIFVYDIEERKPIKEIIASFPICSFAVHEDGVTLAAGTTVGTVLIYSLYRLNKPIEVTVFPSSPVLCIAFKKPKKSSRRANAAKVSKQVVREILSGNAANSNQVELAPESLIPSTPSYKSSYSSGIQLFTPMRNGNANMELDEESDSLSFAASMKSKLMSSVKQAPAIPSNVATQESSLPIATSVQQVSRTQAMTHDPETRDNFNFKNALKNIESSPMELAQQQAGNRGQGSYTQTETSQPFQVQFIKNAIREFIESYQFALHEDIRNLHLDMLRQFHLQSDQTNQLIINLTNQVKDLSEQVRKLQQENQRLKLLHSPYD
jgi:WD40 repeat protein